MPFVAIRVLLLLFNFSRLKKLTILYTAYHSIEYEIISSHLRTKTIITLCKMTQITIVNK